MMMIMMIVMAEECHSVGGSAEGWSLSTEASLLYVASR